MQTNCVQYYHDVLYGALFHNSHLQNTYPPVQLKINNAFIPCVVVENTPDHSCKLQMTDWWVLKYITSSAGAITYTKVILNLKTMF